MIDWLTIHPEILGLLTFILIYSDWLLTIAQEKQRIKHYSEHYQGYPINTIEGNPILRKDVHRLKIINLRHIIIAILISLLIYYDIPKESVSRSQLFPIVK